MRQRYGKKKKKGEYRELQPILYPKVFKSKTENGDIVDPQDSTRFRVFIVTLYHVFNLHEGI